ncbi:MAG: sugar ABC transporter ATP-binding protein [Clostridiaceae bacterium]|nr:sugar ABC transporter ATP-binding protein [Clostridiaceae bacterium]
MSKNTICKIENIEKRFPGTIALKNVSFEIKEGEVHALIGENGAGKSTLMNILNGVLQASKGKIIFMGEECNFANPNDANHAGIAMIHQELSLAPAMTAAENIFLNRMPKTKLGLVDYKKMHEDCLFLLNNLGVDHISPNSLVRDLSVSEQQLLEISKAISYDAKMLIMDEPTSSLTEKEVDFLLNIVDKLRSRGVTIIYISHKLEEVLSISDTITILRDGEHIITSPTKDMNEHKMISYMVGREYEGTHIRNFIKDYSVLKPILSVENLSDFEGKVNNVSFELYPGEVLGFAGLVGAGRTEVLECIFGARRKKSGTIKINGEEANFDNCAKAIDAGIGLIPEGRKIQGIFSKMSVKENMLLVYQRCTSKRGILNNKALDGIASEAKNNLNVKTPSLDVLITNLSGGNQQKTIVARWLVNKPSILFMDEPTHGIDIGAKNEIYKIIDNLTSVGVAVVLISSEMPEILSLSDRILVMHHGYKRGEFLNENITQETLMSYTLDEAMTDDERLAISKIS